MYFCDLLLDVDVSLKYPNILFINIVETQKQEYLLKKMRAHTLIKILRLIVIR